MTADQLNLTARQHDALIKVLGMLERGELKHGPYHLSKAKIFNMGTWWIEGGCSTAGCIGGWANHIAGSVLFNGIRNYNAPLRCLLYPGAEPECEDSNIRYSSITTEEAAQALSNYLTTGKADWRSVLFE